MEKELYISSTPTDVDIALVEDGKLVEIHHQKTNTNFSVGDIFVGRIKKLMPGLNAAFVDIGHKRDAFLHYTDLGPKLKSLVKYTQGVVNGSITTHKLDNFKLENDIIKTGKVDQVLAKKDFVLVQILKEPISTKGPRLTCEVTIPGRYIVLSPFTEGVAVSKKILNPDERNRLHEILEAIKPKNFGVIVRTAAEGKKVSELKEEFALLNHKWEEIFRQLTVSKNPTKLLSELDKASSILRDILNDSFNKIVLDDKELYDNIKNYLSTIAPDQVKILSLHKNKKPLFETYGVIKQIKSSFGKTATMSSGAYLVIEHTEAMHVIDVNSGHKVSLNDAESAILSVNLEAAEEITRQLRLRDLGGLVVIDFIDMKNVEHKKALHHAMHEAMKRDRAQHTILPLSKFGLMQITRQRVRPEVNINTSEVCPTCKGTAKVTPTILLTDEIARDLEFILQSQPQSRIELQTHPFVYAFLKKGIPSVQMSWYLKYYKWIKVHPNSNYGLTEYHFFDDNNDEIRLN
ncbi:MAG: Rne/Rng family ribonuclease [Saprospiraceae bacterium]|nr:Rne/Rng family ribonuclease [Saprospiraceae bacterium]